jgi:hypothetical protein
MRASCMLEVPTIRTLVHPGNLCPQGVLIFLFVQADEAPPPGFLRGTITHSM